MSALHAVPAVEPPLASWGKNIEGHANKAIYELINVGVNVREMRIESEAFGEIDPRVLGNALCSLFTALDELQNIVALSQDMADDEVKP